MSRNRKNMRVTLLVLILLLGYAPMYVEATSGRALTTEIVMSQKLWESADTLVADVYVSGAPYNRDITLNWELSDENGVITNGTKIFQMGGTTHIVQLSLSQFYDGGTFHDLSVEVILDSNVATDNFELTILRNSLLSPASNLVVFGDSLSDMGNGNSSALVSLAFSSPPHW